MANGRSMRDGQTTMPERSQAALVWASLILSTIYGFALILLMQVLPPPDADQTATEVAAFYTEHAEQVRLGAVICSWTAATIFPLWFVIGVQIRRLEGERAIWGPLTMVSGGLLTIFLVFPPIFFGAAAFSPERDPDITKALHEIGVLILVSTDQYFVFAWVALVVACFIPTQLAHSPFPRWFGYVNIWFILIAEMGAICYYFKTGPFAWNGLFPFWIPFAAFGLWIPVISYLLLRALKAQARALTTWEAHEPQTAVGGPR